LFNNPFREQAVAASANRQQLDRLLRVTAPHERIVLAAVGLILAGLGSWIVFGSIARDLSLEGALLAPGQRHEVVATEPGYFMEFLVEPGDRVEPGTAIARQSVPELAGETAVLRDRVARLELDVEQAAGDAGNTRALLAAARVALSQIEAQRAARELIVSPLAGEVLALRSSPGDYLLAGAAVALLRDAEDRRLQATLHVAPRVARRLRRGMQASVDVQLPGGSTQRLEGTVSAVAAGPSPVSLSELQPLAAASALRVDIDLQPAPDLVLPDGTPCRVRIVLGRYSPASLLLGLGSS